MNLCACGCGEEVKPGNKYIIGHNIKKGHKWSKRSSDHIKKIIENRKKNKELKDSGKLLPLCKCGCGQRVSKYSNNYISGHHPTNGFADHKHSSKTKKKFSKIFKSDEFQNKKTKTMIARYGVKHAFQNKELLLKAQETLYQKTGYRNASKNPEEIKKALKTRRKTNVDRGMWLSQDELELFDIYYRKVWYFTNKSSKIKYSEDELNKRSRNGIEGGLQLDHKYSIYEGFKNHILPSIIGSCYNIELISWEENNKKSINCSITKEELFDNYNKGD